MHSGPSALSHADCMLQNFTCGWSQQPSLMQTAFGKPLSEDSHHLKATFADGESKKKKTKKKSLTAADNAEAHPAIAELAVAATPGPADESADPFKSSKKKKKLKAPGLPETPSLPASEAAAGEGTEKKKKKKKKSLVEA